MSEPALLAETTRGDRVESRHYGHVAVVDRSGRLLYGAGDAERMIFPRSSLKPLQALAVVRSGAAAGTSPAEIAVICASHAAEPRHRAAVRTLLARAGAEESDLHCGPHEPPDRESRDELIRQGLAPGPIYNNCSGKHAGMLLLARRLGAPLEGYWLPDHPVQREIQDVLARFCDWPGAAEAWGVDGCGVPNYCLPLRLLALGIARLAAESPGEPGREIVEAMTRHPGMVRGRGGWDSLLMEALGGAAISKGGAEGCQVIGLVDAGIAVAVKVEDGSARPLPPLSLAILDRLGLLPDPVPALLQPYLRPAVLNTRGDVVGEVTVRLPEGSSG